MGCAPQAANSARCSSSSTNQEIIWAVGSYLPAARYRQEPLRLDSSQSQHRTALYSSLMRSRQTVGERVPIFYESRPPARAERTFFLAEGSDGLLGSPGRSGLRRNNSSRNANANTQRTRITTKAFNILPNLRQTYAPAAGRTIRQNLHKVTGEGNSFSGTQECKLRQRQRSRRERQQPSMRYEVFSVEVPLLR